ncbi:MAG: hypothetical protein KDB41_08835 [Propionibacteriaceae bacterium]|jgi:hypothetical protein|nr:hypothetical protein [Propionibacteriaceae bacterium]
MTNVPDKLPAFEAGARLLQREETDPNMTRPAATVVGAVLVLVRAAIGAVVLAGVMRGWDGLLSAVDSAVEVLGFASDGAPWLRAVVFSLGAALLLFQAVLAVLILRGSNWARVLVMFVAVFDIYTTFIAWLTREQELTLSGSIYSLAIDILILLALSSQAAASYARRNDPVE